MKQAFFTWLLCATFLSSAAAFAEEPAAEMEAKPLGGERVDVAPTADQQAAGSGESADKWAQADATIGAVGPKAHEVTVILTEAIQRALDNSPRLKASEASFLASQGERRQADALPNPGIDVDVENVGGGKELREGNPRQTTFGVSQQIEVGGKRSARTDIAEQGVTLARFDNEAARLDLIRDVQLAYADSVAAQVQVVIAEDEKTRATAMLKTVKQRVGAAREPLIQQSKAEVAFASAEIGVEQAQRQLAAAKKTLSSLWQGEATFTLDEATFFNIAPPQILLGSSDRLKRNPDFARYENELLKRKAALDLERANAFPDPTVTAGVRNYERFSGQTFVVGVSFPIPVFNANRGNIEKARQELSQAEFNNETSALALNANLVKEQAELETAYQQAASMREKILPSAEKAFRLSREAYGVGKLPYLEVLDAQRTLFDTREQYLTTLKNYHRAKAEVERLTAEHKADAPIQEMNHE